MLFIIMYFGVDYYYYNTLTQIKAELNSLGFVVNDNL